MGIHVSQRILALSFGFAQIQSVRGWRWHDCFCSMRPIGARFRNATAAAAAAGDCSFGMQ